MHNRKFLTILSWLLLKNVLATVALAAVIAVRNAVPVEFHVYTILLLLMIPIGDWIRGRLVPKYCEDHFANMSRRFKVLWRLVWSGIFAGLAIVMLSGVLNPGHFKVLDRNGDDKVSIDELSRFMGRDSRESAIHLMHRLDGDKDGYLSQQEYEAAFNLVAGGPDDGGPSETRMDEMK